MKSIYASPLRVYLALGLIALAGIWSGLSLPTSLFPNSTKPTVGVYFNLRGLTPQKFMKDYGYELEEALKAISRSSSSSLVEAERVVTSIRPEDGRIEVDFKWGTPAMDAVREVQAVVNSYGARMPDEVRSSLNVWQSRSNSGFFAASIASSRRSMDEVYDIVSPILNAKLARIVDADRPELYNPNQRETLIELDPGRLTSLGIMPRAVDQAVRAALVGMGAGSIRSETGASVSILFAKQLLSLKELRELPVRSSSGKLVHLGDFARIDYGLPENARRMFRTSGVPSQILWGQPKPQGNIKKMSEDLVVAIEETKKLVPADIEFKILVDPSKFIRASVNNVFKEVILGATLAVLVLFIFIGSLKNVVTAAIEIPLSMILAFILMKFSGMNLNMISLGGLALSAGMNVDASVVVMENIFRHFEIWREENPERVQAKNEPNFAEKLGLVTQAVREVRFSVISSTIASLVVFAPLAFTSELSYAVLGDLAKTVVYSHGFSAIVALILVPTVRLQLMKKRVDYPRSPFEKQVSWIEDTYARLLRAFLTRSRVRMGLYSGASLVLVVLVAWVLPGLPKEIIGTPDTDWVFVGLNMKGNRITRQADEQIQVVDGKLRGQFAQHIDYTFVQVNDANYGVILAHLKDKKSMTELTPLIEKEFPNTPTHQLNVGPWNPAELPLPNPPQMKLVVRGSGTAGLAELAPAAQSLSQFLMAQKVLPRIWTEPDTDRTETIVLRPNPDREVSVLNDVADLLYVATRGTRLGALEVEGRTSTLFMRFKKGSLENFEDLTSYPIQMGGKIVPLRALMPVTLEKQVLGIHREEGMDLVSVIGRSFGGGKGGRFKRARTKSTFDGESVTDEQLEQKIEEWRKLKPELSRGIVVQIEDAQKDLNSALKQLALATGLSVLLIFVTMVIQFGEIMSALLVLVAIPLGLIGVLLSLLVAGSTLSLNSVLGIILLNGISVANSIILVDFIKQRVAAGLSPVHAAIDAGRKRLRPILITSLTTILGMMPIAFGFGEGGKILQPLGIAVSGGLWISMLLTLFFVPGLQVWWLERCQAKARRANFNGNLLGMILIIAAMLGVVGQRVYANERQPSANEGLQQISFLDAVKLGLERSPVLAQTRLDAKIAGAQVLGQTLAFGPSFGLSSQLVGHTQVEYVDGAKASQDAASWSANASLSLFRFGRDWFGFQSARATARSADESIVARQLELERNLVESILNWVGRVRSRDSVKQTVENLDQSHKIADQRYQKGLQALQEVQKVQIDLENARARLANAQIAVLEAQRELEITLGPGVLVNADWPFKAQILESSGEQVLPVSTSLESRPDWRVLSAQVQSAVQAKRAAVSSYLPSLSWTGSLSQSNARFGDWSTRPQVWSTAVSATWTLWDGGSTMTTQRVQGFVLEQREQSLLLLERQIKAEWSIVRQIYETQKSAALSREKILSVAAQLYRDSMKRFEMGRATSNDLFVEQSRLLDAQLNSIESWSQSHLAYIKLLHSKGQRLVEL